MPAIDDVSSAGFVVARPTGRGRFQAEIAVRGGVIVADEPVEAGGDGTGPTPYELLAAALAACTAMTLKLYSERKGWKLPPFSVAAAHSTDAARDRFTRRIAFDAPLGPDQETKLLDVANKCPVHRTLMRGFEIFTEIGERPAPVPAEPAAQHEKDMEAACRD
jgi:putative redox protein